MRVPVKVPLNMKAVDAANHLSFSQSLYPVFASEKSDVRKDDSYIHWSGSSS